MHLNLRSLSLTLMRTASAGTLALALSFTDATITSAGSVDADSGGTTLTWTNPTDHRMQYDRYGVLQFAPHNKVGYSEDVSNWSNGNTTDTGTSTIIAAAGSGTSKILYRSVSAPAGEKHRLSARVSSGTHDYIQILAQSATSNQYTYIVVDCDSGTISDSVASNTTLHTSDITDNGDGTYDVYFEYTGTSNVQFFVISVAESASGDSVNAQGQIVWSASAAGTESVNATRMQLSRCPSPVNYIKTNDATAVYGARAGTDNRKPVTNWLNHPENLDSDVSSWETFRVSTSTGQSDPFGGTRATKLVETTDNGTHLIRQILTNNMTGGGTGAIYAKAGERSRIGVYLLGPNKGRGFDLSDGTSFDASTELGIPVSGGWNITPVEGQSGWYRISATEINVDITQIQIYISNGTTGTYTGDGSSGLYISHAMLNEGGIEDYVGSHNLILDDDPDGDTVFSGWTAVSTATITSDSTTAPDGTTTADTLGDDSSTGTGQVYVQKPVTLPEAGTYRFYVLVKSKQLNWLKLHQSGFDEGGVGSNFDLDNATLGVDDSNGRITYWNNGWSLCSIDITTSSDLSGTLWLRLGSADNNLTVDLDGTSDIYIWGAELKRVQAGSSFEFPPCCMPATGYVLNGYTAEDSATNLCTESDDFTTAWIANSVGSVTITANQSVGADGLTTLDKLEITDATNEVHNLYHTINYTADTDMCFAVDVRADAQQHVGINFNTSAEDFACVVFDLYSGTAVTTDVGTTSGTINDYGVISLGNGLYRIWQSSSISQTDASARVEIAFYSSASPTFDTVGRESYAGTAGDAFYAGGVQIETGTKPSSLVKTDGGTETRTRDVLTLTDLSWYNENAGTFVAEFYSALVGNGSEHVCQMGHTSNDRIAALSGIQYHLYVQDGGANQVNLDNGTTISNVRTKTAIALEEDNFAVVLTGNTVSTDTSGTLPALSDMDSLQIGYNLPGSAGQIEGSIRSLQYYSERKSDADLATLSTITDDGTSWLDERMAA